MEDTKSFYGFYLPHKVDDYLLSNLDVLFENVQSGLSNISSWSWRKEALLTCACVYKQSSKSIVNCILNNTVNAKTVGVNKLSFIMYLLSFIEGKQRTVTNRNFIDLLTTDNNVVPSVPQIDKSVTEKINLIFGYSAPEDNEVISKWVSNDNGLIDFIETTWIIHTNRAIV